MYVDMCLNLFVSAGRECACEPLLVPERRGTVAEASMYFPGVFFRSEASSWRGTLRDGIFEPKHHLFDNVCRHGRRVALRTAKP